MAQSVSVKKTVVKDISFANIFWRKFAIRLAVLLLVSILLFTVGQTITMSIVQDKVDSILTKTSFSLAQLADMNIAEDKMTTMTNITLSSAQEELDDIGFVVDSSLSMYNLSELQLVAQSFEIPVVDSDELITWWRGQTNIEVGLPIIYLNDAMKTFCDNHAEDHVYIKKVYCLNSLLFPSELVAKNKDGEELEVIEDAIPTISNQYPKVTPIELEIIGNEVGDTIYGLMYDFRFQRESPTESDSMTVMYADEIVGDKVELLTRTFMINDTEYQVDCGYQLSFWAGAWQYIIAFELFSILMCAIVAFINTKETLYVYR